MGRIICRENETNKEVIINHSFRAFLLIFSIGIVVLLPILYFSGVEIENKHFLFKGYSQATLYLIAIALILIVNFVFISPKIYFAVDVKTNSLIVKKTNFCFIKTTYFFNKKDEAKLIGKKKFGILLTEEGIVRAYKPFLRFYRNGKEIDLKLFPWIGAIYIQKLDWDNTFSLTRNEIEEITDFLDIKLSIE